MRFSIPILVALLAVAGPAAARIYKWSDETGQVHYTQQPPPGGASSDDVEVVKDDAETGIELPEDVRERFCTDVTDMARKLAMAMRRGAPVSAMMRLGQRSAAGSLTNAVVSYVWTYHASDENPSSIAASVRAKCHNGAYNRHLEQYWHEKYPDRPFPWRTHDGRTPARISMGTAWAISPRMAVTSLHVVADSERIEIVFGKNDRVAARVVAANREHDLARLRLEDTTHTLTSLPIDTEPVNLGASVLTIGFPHVDVMGRSPKVTTGVVSALAGPHDDERFYQISAPVQAGNSGGPLLDEHGHVIGVIAAKLDADAVYRNSGDRPENVNYAIKSTYLGKWATRDATDADAAALDAETLVSRVRDSVFIVLAH